MPRGPTNLFPKMTNTSAGLGVPLNMFVLLLPPPPAMAIVICKALCLKLLGVKGSVVAAVHNNINRNDNGSNHDSKNSYGNSSTHSNGNSTDIVPTKVMLVVVIIGTLGFF